MYNHSVSLKQQAICRVLRSPYYLLSYQKYVHKNKVAVEREYGLVVVIRYGILGDPSNRDGKLRVCYI